MKVDEQSARGFSHFAPFGRSVGQQPTAADGQSPSGSLALDKVPQRPQVWSVVSYALRFRLVFSMLTVLVGVFACFEASVAQAQVSVSESHAHAAVAGLQHGQAPTGPLQHATTEMSGAQSVEDSPDDEEFADLAKWLVGRAAAFVQHGPASIQLEPSHAPSTQLDRPPRV